jgi:hypothetical protein
MTANDLHIREPDQIRIDCVRRVRGVKVNDFQAIRHNHGQGSEYRMHRDDHAQGDADAPG